MSLNAPSTLTAWVSGLVVEPYYSLYWGYNCEMKSAVMMVQPVILADTQTPCSNCNVPCRRDTHLYMHRQRYPLEEVFAGQLVVKFAIWETLISLYFKLVVTVFVAFCSLLNTWNQVLATDACLNVLRTIVLRTPLTRIRRHFPDRYLQLIFSLQKIYGRS